MARGGPWLTMAVLCQEAGIDSTGRHFVHGLMDKADLVAQGVEPPPGVPYEVDGTLLLALQMRAGDARSPIQLRIDIEDDAGDVSLGEIQTIEFIGAGVSRGFWENVTLQTRFQRSGPYLINVVVNSRLMTRIPFTVNILWSNRPHA